MYNEIDIYYVTFLYQFATLSTDSAYSHFAWMTLVKEVETFNALGTTIPFPMLADKTQVLSRQLDVLDEDTGLAKHCVLLFDSEGEEVNRLGCASSVIEADCQDLACAFTFTEVLEAVKEAFGREEEEEGGDPEEEEEEKQETEEEEEQEEE